MSVTAPAARRESQPAGFDTPASDTPASHLATLAAHPGGAKALADAKAPAETKALADTKAPANAKTPADTEAPAGAEALERDQLLDRLGSLRRVLPALAQEMAAARRQAARLRTDNRRLAEQVRRLRATLEDREHKRA